MLDLLLICPTYDDVTKRFRQWIGDVESTATRAGRPIRSLYQSAATRSAVEGALRGASPAAVVFYGHGRENELLENKTNAILDGSNADLLRGTVVVALACDSAALLGKQAVEKGARAYIGYSRKFFFMYGDPEVRFRSAAGSAALVLLSNSSATCAAALRAAKKEYEDNIDFYARGAGTTQYDADIAASWFNWDGDYLTLLGDPNAHL